MTQTKIADLRKGCNQCSINSKLRNLRPNADVSKWSCKEDNLCPTCKAKLSITIEETKKQIEILKGFVEFLEKLMPITNGLQSKSGTTMGLSEMKPLKVLKISIKLEIQELNNQIKELESEING